MSVHVCLGLNQCQECATDTVGLSEPEARALAKRLIARNAATDWLAWEDVPLLSERAFARLSQAVDVEVAAMSQAVMQHDRAADVDSADLLSRAQ